MEHGTTRLEALAAEAPDQARGRFAAVASSGLCALGPPGRTGATLALEFGLSAWMRMAGVGLEEARRGLWSLRGAILDAGGLDPSTEPVPFSGRDRRADTLTLAAYLGDLLARAARAKGTDPATIAARATDALLA